MMKCTLDERDISASSLMCRPMNFSQPVPGLLPLSYRMSIETVQLMKFILADYNEFIQGEQEDNSNEPGEWPTLDSLKQLGYPPLAMLVQQAPQLLEELIKEWLTMEVLDTLFPYSQELTKPQYSINTLDKVRIDTKLAVLEGQAYPLFVVATRPSRKMGSETPRHDSQVGQVEWATELSLPVVSSA